MSFIITLYVREGIVLASDSRTSLRAQQINQHGEPTVNFTVGLSDSNYKTFLAYNRIGISTFGQADINDIPITGFIESFISKEGNQDSITPDELALKILEHFRQYEPVPDTGFHVAGYTEENGILNQRIYKVEIALNKITLINNSIPPNIDIQGAGWDGETEVLTRLLKPTFLFDSDSKQFHKLPDVQIPWNFFNLQDAIDFAVFAIKTTIDSFKFQTRPKTVGGPIDVLVIKPNRAFWVSKKELRM